MNLRIYEQIEHKKRNDSVSKQAQSTYCIYFRPILVCSLSRRAESECFNVCTCV